ncbi:hypothetical protein TVAG_225520 [Trichomonas vaginalis G3]|uniref:Uncharacterized protein n=1 Tax=Trichomonas vaginalis (strain ATCC PRA-98 / G3) TaxID=412133 RepID=A2DNT1_TRIV3|nr:hypothetical protein TVAGG3_0288880 [Trichomonas vaginalis G3]EAY17926.1 hypothetical protein TVAG_225520 [Trichomonas vaginalis G3]KAI5527103.1 hypothetical protein TVAGG3_0288880 [Trichomonas vaginalis G3]|eukprot:XP_001578912.1 hypothetical protein [Trichomonas vaginalis G3]
MSTGSRLDQLYQGGIKRTQSKDVIELRIKEKEKWEKTLMASNKLVEQKGTKLSKSPVTQSTSCLLQSSSSIFLAARPSKVKHDKTARKRKHSTIPTSDLTRAVKELGLCKTDSHGSLKSIPFPIETELPELKITTPVSSTINSLERFLL